MCAWHHPGAAQSPRYSSVLVLATQGLSSQVQVILTHPSPSYLQKTYFHLLRPCGPTSQVPKFCQQQSLISHIAHVSPEWQSSFINENPVLGTVRPYVVGPPFPSPFPGPRKKKGLLPPPAISISETASLERMPGILGGGPGESRNKGREKDSFRKVSSGYCLPSGEGNVSNYETMSGCIWRRMRHQHSAVSEDT